MNEPQIHNSLYFVKQNYYANSLDNSFPEALQEQQNSHQEGPPQHPTSTTPLTDNQQTPQTYEEFTNNFTSIAGLNMNFANGSAQNNNEQSNETNEPQTTYLAPTTEQEHLTEQPFYVNAKQYHRILKRRVARAKLEESLKVARGRRPYLHESRHKHAMRRPRGQGGRFLTAAEIAERERAAANSINSEVTGESASAASTTSTDADSENNLVPTTQG